MAPSRPQESAVPGFHLLADRAACCAKCRSDTGDISVLNSSCKIGYDRISGAVLFRIYVRLAITTSPNNQKTPLYVFIDPLHVSHLQTLSVDESEATQACVGFLITSGQCSSSADVVALRFLLNRPATVVGPKEITSLKPRPESFRALEALRSLSLTTDLTLYLPRNETLDECLDDLCAGARNGTFRSPPPVYCLDDLYSGAGGVDISALLNEVAAGGSRGLPGYPGIASTTVSNIRPTTSVSGQASAKRRRTNADNDGPAPNEAWMQRIERQQSDLGDSLGHLQAEMDNMRRGREREHSVAPLEFRHTRPVTRSVSARLEATATTHRLDEVQHHLQQVHARLGAMEHQLDSRLSTLEHRVQAMPETRCEQPINRVQVVHSPTPQQPPQTPRIHSTPPNFSIAIPHGIFSHPASHIPASSTPHPPSSLFNNRSDDDRLALLQADPSQLHRGDDPDSDEEREALAHAPATAPPPAWTATPVAGAQASASTSPPPPSYIFNDARSSDDERLALLREGVSQPPRSWGGVDEDEEREALAHEAGRATTRDAAAGEMGCGEGDAAERLFAELVGWLRGASAVGGANVYRHPRLQGKLGAMGRWAREGEVAAFDASRAWCSAVLFFYGVDGGDDGRQRLCGDEARGLLADMAGLVRWANEKCRACDVCVEPVRGAFVRLGAAARDLVAAVDLGRVAATAVYERQRDVCVARVLTLAGNKGR